STLPMLPVPMPSSDLRLGDRLRRDALVRHGVGSGAVRAVVRAADTVRRLTRTHGVEVAATYGCGVRRGASAHRARHAPFRARRFAPDGAGAHPGVRHAA